MQCNTQLVDRVLQRPGGRLPDVECRRVIIPKARLSEGSLNGFLQECVWHSDVPCRKGSGCCVTVIHLAPRFKVCSEVCFKGLLSWRQLSALLYLHKGVSRKCIMERGRLKFSHLLRHRDDFRAFFIHPERLCVKVTAGYEGDYPVTHVSVDKEL